MGTAGALTIDNPARSERDGTLIQDRLSGMTYSELAAKHGIAKSTVCRVLTKPEIRDVLDAGTSQMLSLIPKACHIHQKAMESHDDNGNPTALSLKAAETVLKTGAILPTNTVNQTVTQIYNIQNNITLNPGVATALTTSLTQDDPDTIDAEFTHAD